jgi:hypothetical protein
MKSIILSLLLLPLTLCGQFTFPLNNAKLVTNLDANGQDITNVDTLVFGSGQGVVLSVSDGVLQIGGSPVGDGDYLRLDGGTMMGSLVVDTGATITVSESSTAARVIIDPTTIEMWVGSTNQSSQISYNTWSVFPTHEPEELHHRLILSTYTSGNDLTWILPDASGTVALTNQLFITGSSVNTTANIHALYSFTPLDNGVVPPSPRGKGAVDLQIYRLSSDQVASESFSVVGGGSSNKANASYATVGGGQSNQATESYATVGGGQSNQATAQRATVGGGLFNIANATSATVSGGHGNEATATYATVGGGGSNYATASYTTVSGGSSNYATAQLTTVGGGSSNQATATSATVSGGNSNEATAWYTTVGGGEFNRATGQHATVGGGHLNYAAQQYSGIGSGHSNIITPQRVFDITSAVYSAPNTTFIIPNGDFTTHFGDPAVVDAILVGSSSYWGVTTLVSKSYDGGSNATTLVVQGAYASASYVTNIVLNYAFNRHSTISGGGANRASSPYATVGGGQFNRAIASHATVGGGSNNEATASYTTVGGGDSNSATGYSSTVSGGLLNLATGASATVGGGQSNSATSSYSTVGGGFDNSANANGGVVGGGTSNAAGASATVSGGAGNYATGSHSSVGGGSSNEASGSSSVISGGASNVSAADHSNINGGQSNVISDGGTHSVILGGQGNVIDTTSFGSPSHSVIVGGRGNRVYAPYSVAMGRGAVAKRHGEIVHSSHLSTISSKSQSFHTTLSAIEQSGGHTYLRVAPSTNFVLLDDTATTGIIKVMCINAEGNKLSMFIRQFTTSPKTSLTLTTIGTDVNPDGLVLVIQKDIDSTQLEIYFDTVFVAASGSITGLEITGGFDL